MLHATLKNWVWPGDEATAGLDASIGNMQRGFQSIKNASLLSTRRMQGINWDAAYKNIAP